MPLILAPALLAHALLASPDLADLRYDAAQAPVYVGPMAGRPALADLDADGDLDVVIVCGPCCGRDPQADSGHVLTLLNDGDGRLRQATPRVKLGPTALGAAVGDLNHDGAPDVVAYHHGSYDLAVLMGAGDGALSAPRFYTMNTGDSPHVHAVALADVNNDGHPDAIATLVDDHALAVLLGDGRGGLTPAPAQPFFAQRHPYAQLAVTDLTEDGEPDAFMTDVRGGGVTLLAGSGTGMFANASGFSFETSMPVRAAERPIAAALGDLDRDGDPDAIVFTDESPLAVRMINTGNGAFVESDDPLIDLGIPSAGGTLADLNNDGLLDIVASSAAGRRVACRLARPDGSFVDPVLIDARGEKPAVSVGDMNGDGRPDLVTSNYDSGTLSVLLRVGDE